jgi:hypothetical protein
VSKDSADDVEVDVMTQASLRGMGYMTEVPTEDEATQRYEFVVSADHPSKNLQVRIMRREIEFDHSNVHSMPGYDSPNGIYYSMSFGVIEK